MKHLFIINPVAGSMKYAEKEQRINGVIANLPSSVRRDNKFEVYVTRARMDAYEKVKAEADTGEPLRVYACGGDGTLNECVNGAVLHPNAAVTHWPIGTGNDFVRMFGRERKKFRDLASLVTGEVRPMDAIDCNGRWCINICSVGVDARVGTEVHKFSDLPVIGGATGYVASVVTNYARGISDEMTATAEGLTCGPELNMVCVCNGRFYGGGFNPVPEAMPDDGLMDCLVVSGVNRFTFLGAIAAYARGDYRRLPQYITHVRTTQLELHAKREQVINVDGEAERGKDIVFRLQPGAVNFVFPAGMEFFAGRS